MHWYNFKDTKNSSKHFIVCKVQSWAGKRAGGVTSHTRRLSLHTDGGGDDDDGDDDDSGDDDVDRDGDGDKKSRAGGVFFPQVETFPPHGHLEETQEKYRDPGT